MSSKSKKSKKEEQDSDVEVHKKDKKQKKEKAHSSSEAESDSEVERKSKKEKKEKKEEKKEKKSDSAKKKSSKPASDSESDSEEEKKKAKKEKKEKKEKTDSAKKKSKPASDSESDSEAEKDKKKKSKKEDDKKPKEEKESKKPKEEKEPKKPKEEKAKKEEKADESKNSKKRKEKEKSDDEESAKESKESNGHASKKQKLDNGAAATKQSALEIAEAWRKENSISVPSDAPFPITNFEDPALPEAAKKALKTLKFDAPTAVQAQSWPIVFAGRDIVSIAETGSGKTLAFVIPAIMHILKQYKESGVEKAANSKAAPFAQRGNTWLKPSLYPVGRPPLALFMAPTRELAIQINEVCEKLCSQLHLSSACIYGGAPKNQQVTAIRRGADIIVATPGRCYDLYNQSLLKLSSVGFVVLDEADRMLDMGFEPQIKDILSEIKKDRQTMMFSATWPKEVQALASQYQVNPIKMVVGKPGLQANRKITQHFKFCSFPERVECLKTLLNEIFVDNCKILIFNNTKLNCEAVGQELWDAGKPVNVIHGDMEQHVRERALAGFKSGKFPLLIATDVAARGIDIRDIKYVINYTLPANVEDYVHRIGRTGRGGDSGVAYSIICPKDKIPAKALVPLLQQADQVVPPELQAMAPSSGGGGRWGGRGGRGGRGGGGGGRSTWGMRRGGGGGGRGGYGGY